ncbi:MAG: hypothetical protein M1822_007858 [Bathelium mastoideum]|nr:MAG: hypothetical protein M1822_007858 [Bathelium mastoideum]
MAATKSSPSFEAGATPLGFSYAQAAKKPSAPPPAPTVPNNLHEAVENHKDALLDKPTKNWAEDAEENVEPTKVSTQSSTVSESTAIAQERPQPSQTPSESQATVVSTISTPEFGISSTSTLAEKEETSSIPNTSSESTWESKSQASNPAEKSTGSQKEPSPRSEDTTKESAPLKEAPPPPVNIWQQRAKEQQAVKVATHTSSAKVTSPVNVSTEPNSKTRFPGAREVAGSDSRRKARSASAGRDGGNTAPNKDRKRSVDTVGKNREDGRATQSRRPSRFDHDGERSSMKKAGPKSILSEQEETTALAEPPSVNDETSWPAMGANVHEEKQRKPQEKEEKERASAPGSKSHGKQEWVQIPIPQTTYLFDTPLPNTNPRRGGRGGSRGGRDGGGRGAFSNANGYVKGEKSAGAESPAQSNDVLSSKSKRDKSEGSQSQASEHQATDTMSSDKEGADDRSADAIAPSSTVPAKINAQGGTESGRKGSQSIKESQPAHSYSSRHSGAPRWKQSQRNGDPENDRRRESEADARRESRRLSSATQIDEPRERRSTVTGESPQASRYDKHDRREEFSSRPWKESGHETFAPRGGGRGRGRGSRRGGFPHGFHQSSHNAPSGMHGSSYGFPTSPTYQQQFGSPFNSQRGYRGPRVQSVPNGDYGRGTGAYPAGPGQVPPLQTWFDPATAYEYQMMQSMSAVPWTPQMEPFALVGRVIQQVEYYLSLENMLKDTFLRSHMDSKGYLDLEVVANFNRLKGYDMEMIKLGCYESSEIDLKVDAEGNYKIRKSNGWQQWVLEMDKRKPNAQNDGSDQLTTPPRPQPAQLYVDPFQYGPQSPLSPGPIANSQNGYPMNSPYHTMGRMSVPSYPFSAPPDFVHPGDVFSEHQAQEELGHHTPNGEPQQPSHTTFGPSRTGSRQQELDSFPDDKIPGLNVVYRVKDVNSNQAPFHNQESRTFSNRTIDGGDTTSASGRGSELQPSSRLHASGAVPHDGENGNSQINRINSPAPTPVARSKSSQHVEVFWVKDSTTPVDRLPSDTETEPYALLHLNALSDRFNENPELCSKNMHVLYQFWSHFLIRNFNTIMYNEFRKFAFEDAAKGSSVGIDHLLEFYGKSLFSQSTVRDRVARHYASLVKREDRDSGRPAFHQLRKQWRDGALNMKNRKRIGEHIDREMRDELET